MPILIRNNQLLVMIIKKDSKLTMEVTRINIICLRLKNRLPLINKRVLIFKLVQATNAILICY